MKINFYDFMYWLPAGITIIAIIGYSFFLDKRFILFWGIIIIIGIFEVLWMKFWLNKKYKDIKQENYY